MMKNKDNQLTYTFSKSAFRSKRLPWALFGMLPGFVAEILFVYQWIRLYRPEGEQWLLLIGSLVTIAILLQAWPIILYDYLRRLRCHNRFTVTGETLTWREMKVGINMEHRELWEYRILAIKDLKRRKSNAIKMIGDLETVRLNNDGTPCRTILNNRMAEEVWVQQRCIIPPYYEDMDALYNELNRHVIPVNAQH